MVVETQPNKALGQHWLHDETVLSEMAESAYDARASLICEIGPGLGTLTRHLLMKGLPVTAIEFDGELAKKLKKSLDSPHIELLNVIEGDIRTYDFTSFNENYVISANIPYYLTSHLIRILTETKNKPLKVALLIQKEVAERIAASPGKMGLLSCITQYFYDTNLGSVVPARLFTPPPKVDSQILILTRKLPKFEAEWPRLLRLLKAGFSEKRKNLKNALSGGLAISKQDAETLLHNARIDVNRRAESLSMSEWQNLYDAFSLLDSLRK